MGRSNVKAPALDSATVEVRLGSAYPDEFKSVTEGREKRGLGDVAGLSHFGVNLVRLKPGAASALRHWHLHEDEFVYVLEGEVTLVTDAGEQVLTPGLAAGFPAGQQDGHNLVNKSGKDAVYLEIGDRHPAEEVHYPDVDLKGGRVDGVFAFTRKDGSAV
ncbi:MAG: cupin domain-containing protein [Alphaproteobacteria bacterium]|nr:cupin domain-containing protein [Alphaproteobacteria bacterium]